MTKTQEIVRGATMSGCGTYRYRLWREYRGFGYDQGTCLFVMLNPSTADAQEDDPTIRKCLGFAHRWGYTRLEVVNLFAYRATNPAELRMLGYKHDPVGPDNIDHVMAAAESAQHIICGWGVHGGHLDQNVTVLGWIWAATEVTTRALKITKDGHPGHPLYIPYNTESVRYE